EYPESKAHDYLINIGKGSGAMALGFTRNEVIRILERIREALNEEV
ncbi:unnamed protein product, partial [marine sediment metagenome]